MTRSARPRQRHRTLAEICFCLAFRNARLAEHLGSPNLFEEARRAAYLANAHSLGAIMGGIERVVRAAVDARLPALGDLAQTLARHADAVEPWLLTEIGAKAKFWVDELEAQSRWATTPPF